MFLGAPLSRGYSSHALLPPCPRRRAWRAPCPTPFGRGLSCAPRGCPPRRSVAAPRPTPPFPLLPSVAGDPSAAPSPVLGAPSGARFSARLLAAPALVAGVAGAGGFAPPFPLPLGLPLPPAFLRGHAHWLVRFLLTRACRPRAPASTIISATSQKKYKPIISPLSLPAMGGWPTHPPSLHPRSPRIPPGFRTVGDTTAVDPQWPTCSTSREGARPPRLRRDAPCPLAVCGTSPHTATSLRLLSLLRLSSHFKTGSLRVPSAMWRPKNKNR